MQNRNLIQQLVKDIFDEELVDFNADRTLYMESWLEEFSPDILTMEIPSTDGLVEQITDKLCKHADSLDWKQPAGAPHRHKVESPEWGPVDGYDTGPEDKTQNPSHSDITAMGASITVVPAPKEPVVRDGNVFYLGGSKFVVKE